MKNSFVETEDGLHQDAFNSGGIWGVDFEDKIAKYLNSYHLFSKLKV